MSRNPEPAFPRTLMALAVGSASLMAGLVWLAMPPAPTGQMSADKMSTRVSHLKAGAPIVSVKVPADLSADAKSGATVFAENCASCHGADGAGLNGVAPPLIHKIYEPSHHGDRAFYSAAANGVRAHHWRFGDMPAIGTVSQNDMGDVITYIREIQKANGIK